MYRAPHTLCLPLCPLVHSHKAPRHVRSFDNFSSAMPAVPPLRPDGSPRPVSTREYSHATPHRGPGPLTGSHADCGQHPCAQFTKDSLKNLRRLIIRSEYGLVPQHIRFRYLDMTYRY